MTEEHKPATGRFFKTALLALLVGFLWIAAGARDRGRYVYCVQQSRVIDVVLDTQTGRIFYVNRNPGKDPQSVEVDAQTGEGSSHWEWTR